MQDRYNLSEQHGPPDPHPFPPTVGQRITAFLIRSMIRLIIVTLRLRVVGEKYLEEARKVSTSDRVILALWHGRQFPLIHVLRDKNLAVLASLSRDGTLVSLVLEGMGYHMLRGSTSRGAVRGLVSTIRAVKDGYDTAFTVDGPRGPQRVVKPGILYTAMKTGATVVPVTSAARRALVFHKSWDNYILPLPFTKVVVLYGEGMMVPKDSDVDDLERIAAGLGEHLDRLTAEAEDMLSEG